MSEQSLNNGPLNAPDQGRPRLSARVGIILLGAARAALLRTRRSPDRRKFWPELGIKLTRLIFGPVMAGAVLIGAMFVGLGWHPAVAQTGPFRPSTTPAANRDFRGYLAVRAGQVIGAENAVQLFTPASVLKLVVAAAALHHLGPGHRRVTLISGAGTLTNGTLTGDLVLSGAADPTWCKRFYPSNPRAPLQSLVRQVHAAGVRRVTGDLIVDTSRFPGPAFPRNRAFYERSAWYGSPQSAVAIDENVAGVQLAPGKTIGLPALVSPTLGNVPLINRTVTVGAERSGRGTIEFYPDPGGQLVVVQGEYPISENSYDLEISVPNPEARVGEALLTMLQAAGVQVDGKVVVSATAGAAVTAAIAPAAPAGRPGVGTPAMGAPGGNATGAARPAGSRATAAPAATTFIPLARLESPPLSEILVPILEKSHNWYAEMLLLILAQEVSGQGRIDVGLDIERAFLEKEVGIPRSAYYLDDASGLSTYNLIAPEAVVALLGYVWKQPWRDELVGAMAEPGKGTLGGYGDLPPLRAKTGTILLTAGLAGILHPERPDPVFFAIFLNHRVADGDGRAEIHRLVKSWDKP